jgi:hypothetical protein
LGCLRPMIQVVLPWLWSWNKSLTNFHSHKKFGLCKKQGLQFANLCLSSQISGVMWWSWHSWTTWWLLLWACVIKYVNMALQMKRLVDYIMHQSNLSKHTSKNVSCGWRNLARGGKCGKKYMWILVWAPTYWTPQSKQNKFINFKILCFMV